MKQPDLPTNEELNRKILWRLRTDTPNAGFGLTETYTTGRKLWAKVEAIYGLAIRANMNTEEVPTHLMWVRYTPSTQPEDFSQESVIDWHGRRFRILNAINVGDAQRFTRLSVKDLGPAT